MAKETLVGRTVAGYKLLDRIGEGGTAEVYRAEHPEHGTCAFKVLRQRLRQDKTAVQRFLREAAFGERVTNDHVVRTYDYGEVNGVDYLALEWADGEALSDFINKAAPLTPQVVANIITQLAEALGAAHAVGIIHRDLKPENIMYDPATQTLKLLDFGIARDAQLPAEERLTRTGFFVGTLQYVAPETLSGELVSDLADIYSVATITYYMLTNAHPFRGRNPRELFQQLLSSEAPPLNESLRDVRFTPELEAAVMKGLSRDPKQRQPTVQEFAREVREASHKDGGIVEKPGMLGKIMGVFGKR